MITKLYIENHGPINEAIKIDFSLRKGSKAPIVKLGTKNISKITSFFGKNGAGKTAILDAINIVRDLVVYGRIHKAFPSFRFNGPSHNKTFWKNVHSNLGTTHIVIDVTNKKNLFTYSLKFQDGKILYESLNVSKIGSKLKTKVLERKETKVLQTKKTKDKSRNISLSISAVNEEITFEKHANKQVKEFFEIMKNILIIRKDYWAYDILNDSVDLLDQIFKQVENGKVKNYENFEDYKKNIIDKLFKIADTGIKEFGLLVLQREEIDRKTGKVKVFKDKKIKPFIENYSKKEAHKQNIKMSYGTYQYLLQLLASLKTINSNGVLIVDDFGGQMHPEVTEILLALFESKKFNKESQLIFNTNQISLINNIDRTQQIFVDNQDGLGTEIRKILRKDSHNRSIYKNFARGAYFGAPSVNIFSILETIEG